MGNQSRDRNTVIINRMSDNSKSDIENIAKHDKSKAKKTSVKKIVFRTIEIVIACAYVLTLAFGRFFDFLKDNEYYKSIDLFSGAAAPISLIRVAKTVASVTTALDTTATVLEIAIPFADTDKKGLVVYSYHGDSVLTFTESDSKANGTFRVDKENGYIYIYSNTFSTYALGYTLTYNLKGSLSIGSFGGTATVILQSEYDGEIYRFDNVAMGSVKFTDIPSGKYIMTVSWIDGVENTLTMSLVVGAENTGLIDNNETEKNTDTTDNFNEDFAAQTIASASVSGYDLAIATYNGNTALNYLQKQIFTMPTMKSRMYE